VLQVDEAVGKLQKSGSHSDEGTLEQLLVTLCQGLLLPVPSQ
jgi:hypothetical protein